MSLGKNKTDKLSSIFDPSSKAESFLKFSFAYEAKLSSVEILKILDSNKSIY